MALSGAPMHVVSHNLKDGRLPFQTFLSLTSDTLKELTGLSFRPGRLRELPLRRCVVSIISYLRALGDDKQSGLQSLTSLCAPPRS